MIGQTLKDRYEVTALIGKGAMGEVFRATDKQTGSDVAVKLMAGQLAFDADMVERFRREGEALRQLRHPNIVGLVDTFLHESRPAAAGAQADGNAATLVDTPPKESSKAAVGGPMSGDAVTMVDAFPRESRQVIVLEYVPGGSLHDLLKREAPLDIPRVKQIVLDLCDALIRAHRLNIVHRDIKPENVLMAEDGTPRLTDFGVARLVGGATRLTGTGTQIGTPYYMSPEAWEGEQLDAQSDIWSLGVMLYEMLSGHVPFGGETLAAVMNKVLTAPLPDLRSARPEAPDGLVQIIERMVTRDRAARYQSMREVAADLERGRPLEAPTIPKKTRPAPKPKVAAAMKGEPIGAAPGRGRLPGWALAIAGVIALSLTGVIAMAVFNLCPPANAWLTPPWCPGSQLTGPFGSPATTAVPVFITDGTLGAVLFEDDFDGEPSMRWEFQPQQWEAATLDGRSVLQNVPTEQEGFASLRGEGWTDYAVQFDFKFLKPDKHNAYYFTVRFRTDDCPPTVPALDNYVAVLSTDASELRDESCETQTQERRAYNDRNFAAEGWHTAQIIAIGNRVQVLVDGQQYFDFTDDDSPHLSGGFSIDMSNKVELAIDNFRVNEIIPGEAAATATAAPAAQPAAEIVTGPACGAGETKLFSDDFEDGDTTGWRIFDGVSGAAKVWPVETESNGNHVLVGSGHVWAAVGEKSWSDYVLRLRIRLVSGKTLLNIRNDTGRYYLNIADGVFGRGHPGSGVLSLRARNDGEWHSVLMSAVGGHVEVVWDGEGIVAYDDPQPFLSGYVGLENIDFEVWYDDVLVCRVSD